jgi:transcriptional regulator with XRE-family HTH domain
MDLKKIRESANLSQIKMAREIGVSLNTYSLWERGGNSPSFENMIKLGLFLNKYGLEADKDDDNFRDLQDKRAKAE